MPAAQWQPLLQEAASAAERSLHEMRPFRQAIIELAEEFREAASDVQFDTEAGSSEEVKQAVTAFAKQFEQLQERLDHLTGVAVDRLDAGYSELERNARFVTVMLFGRTRAGKSTTMEALTYGDGSTIGVGRQHTTTDVNAYYLPRRPENKCESDGPALRIVDTPGIEGFQGEELQEKADAFVEQADHILFLLSDDQASAEELQRFGNIRTQGKSVTVLLNVKAEDDDLDLLLDYPEYIFDDQEIDGHKRRIAGFLAKQFDMPPPPVLPLHARSAWLTRDAEACPVPSTDVELLAERSGITAVEEHLHRFLKEEALGARLRAPSDLLHGYIITLKDELRPFAGSFRGMSRRLSDLRSGLKNAVTRAERRAASGLKTMRLTYDRAIAGIDEFVDELCASGVKGKDLRRHWSRYLEDKDITKAPKLFVTQAERAFVDEVQEHVRTARFETDRKTTTNGLDAIVSKYHQKKDKQHKNKYARAGARASAGAAAAGLATWAVANWWNPSGWVAGAAATVAVSGAAAAGERAAKSGTDSWYESDKRKLYKQKAQIINKLKSQLKHDHAEARSSSIKWLDATIRAYNQLADQTIGVIEKSSKSLWRSTVETLDRLDALAMDIDRHVLSALLPLTCPEAKEDKVTVEAVARLPGDMCKVLVRGNGGLGGNVIGCCIGRGGSRIKHLSHLLNGERITFVDADAPPAEQVAQALNAPGVEAQDVTVLSNANHYRARLNLAGRCAAVAIGRGGSNVRLANSLIDLPINIETPQ